MTFKRLALGGLVPLLAVMAGLATPTAAQAATCSGLTKILGLCPKPAPSVATGGGTQSVTTTCSALAKLVGCKSSPAPSTSGGSAPRATTCTALSTLLGCTSSPAPAPAPAPSATTNPDGSLKLDGADGGLEPLPEHVAAVDLPAAAFPRVAGRLLYGFSDAGPAVTSAAAARITSAMGGSALRVELSWPGVEYAKGAFNFSRTDATYKSLVARGIRPLFVLYNTPRDYVSVKDRTPAICGGTTWNPGRSCMTAPAPSNMHRASDMARRVAVRYPLAAGIEVWNEPNLKLYYKPYPDPERYAALLKAVHEGVNNARTADGRGGNPAMRVFGGAINNVSYSSSEVLADTVFVRRMLAAGGGPYMDLLSLHPYPYSAERSTGWVGTFTRLKGVLDEREEPSLRNIRIALTEIGLSTNVGSRASQSVTPAQQAQGLLNYYAEVDSPFGDLPVLSQVDLVLLHTLDDHVGDGGGGGFGLVGERSDAGQHVVKPAFCAFRTQVAGLTNDIPDDLIVPSDLVDLCGGSGGTVATTRTSSPTSKTMARSAPKAVRSPFSARGLAGRTG